MSMSLRELACKTENLIEGANAICPGIFVSEGYGTISPSWSGIVDITKSSEVDLDVVDVLERSRLLSVRDGCAKVYVAGAEISGIDRRKVEAALERVNCDSGGLIPCYRFEVIQPALNVQNFKPTANINREQIAFSFTLLDQVVLSQSGLLYFELNHPDMIEGLEGCFAAWTRCIPYDFGQLAHISLCDWAHLEGAAIEERLAAAIASIGSSAISMLTCAENVGNLHTNALWSLVTAISESAASGRIVIVAGQKPYQQLAKNYRLWGEVDRNTPCRARVVTTSELEPFMLSNENEADSQYTAQPMKFPAELCDDAAPKTDFVVSDIHEESSDEMASLEAFLDDFVEVAGLIFNVRIANLRGLNQKRDWDQRARSLAAYGFSKLPEPDLKRFNSLMNYPNDKGFDNDVMKGRELVLADVDTQKAFSIFMSEVFNLYSNRFESADDFSDGFCGSLDSDSKNVVPFPIKRRRCDGILTRLLCEV